MDIKTKSKTLSLISLACTALLFGCGSDGKDGEDGPNGEIGLSVGQANELVTTITTAAITDGAIIVEFRVENANGVGITDFDTYPGIDTLGMGIAKLMPQSGKGYKTPQWVNYMNKMVAPVTANIPAGYEDKAGEQIQPTIETNCKQECVEKVSAGLYRYTFAFNLNDATAMGDLDLTYDDSLTHRITMEMRADGDTKKLVNSHFDFLPASGEQVSGLGTRTVEFLENSCLRCHSDEYDHAWAPKLIMHGTKRYAIENCQMCHTSYAGDPETGAPIDMGYMVHQIHRAKYLMVGYRGSVHDYSNVTFPADMYDCRACHQEGDNRPADAFNFKHHRALACGSCHSDSTDPATIKADMHTKYQPDHSCGTCHADQGDEGAAHHVTDAIAKDNARSSYKAALVPGSVSLEAGLLTFSVAVSDTSLTTAAMSPNADKRINYSNIYFGFGNDIDFTSGKQNYKLHELTPTSGSDGIYTYSQPTSLTPDMMQAATAVITTHLCVDRDTLTAVDCGTGSDEANNPAVLPGELVAFNLNGDSSIMARRVVISNETCANCHDDKYLGKFGTKMKHDGNYTNFEGECQMCHNPTYKSNQTAQDHIDFKVRIHAHHANKRTKQQGDDATKVVSFPEHYGNCAVCHDKGQLTLSDLATVPATLTVDAQGNETEYSPIAATCVSCHGEKGSLLAHIRSNGGAASDPRGTYTAGSETCATCHSEGKALGVDAVHPVKW
ncbi:OmcA/MtrC family decaheme c-type cytochrome [Shewanella colwelliana]|uniref:OmcA/MtrC family decaheme c-type cytochrome n=1 Tax=Shewanella colwelliana TaxID=23 RepID=UPI00299E7C98|nr:OmcA/MtrC family decaheme c-type cytochrome [Shewanella colwelliana]MDX1281236.1 OmcA/MtrC family decaheme c-type cytochrome [Shewanella colwelliana]